MPWFEGLDPATLRELFALGIDLEVAAVELVRQPRHASAFAAYGAEIVPFPEVDLLGTVKQPHDPVEYVWFPPKYAEAGRNYMAAALLAANKPATTTKKPRYRPPDGIPKKTVQRMMLELAQRKAKPPRHPEFTQQAIADRLELDRSRVQQAEALQKVGWDLLRSDPEFSANDEFVRWPSAKKAARTLTSGRAEN